MSSINYKDPLNEDVYFQEYLKSKAEVLKQKNTVQRPQSGHMWALVFVLMVSLVGLGITALLQYRNNQELIAKYEGASVAGASETNDLQNIITAEGFSIMLDEPTPSDYTFNREAEAFAYIPGLQAVTSSLKAQLTKNNSTVTSGIEISVAEYDNVLSKSQFADKVVEKLGPNYSKQTGEIIIPKDVSLTNIKNTSASNDSIEYYTAVTANNYYVIKVYNQTSSYPDLASYSKFTDSLISNLYLN